MPEKSACSSEKARVIPIVSRVSAIENDVSISKRGMTTVALVGLRLGPAVVAWIVFRAADIYKNPFPGVAQAERLPDSWGVMTDDIVAGIYGLIAGHIVQTLI